MGYELKVVSPPDPRVCPPKTSPPDYDYADYKRKISMSVIDAENKIHLKHLI